MALRSARRTSSAFWRAKAGARRGRAAAGGRRPGRVRSAAGGLAGSGVTERGLGLPSGHALARPGENPGAAADRYRPARADASRPVVAVDAMGGDHAPAAIVAGAVAAHRERGKGQSCDEDEFSAPAHSHHCLRPGAPLRKDAAASMTVARAGDRGTWQGDLVIGDAG